MTLIMGDSTNPANLPDTFDAYLGYGNGKYENITVLKSMFPDKPVISLSVAGDASNCDGVDIEPGNYDATSGVAAIVNHENPVIYASISGPVGYSIPDVLNALRANGIPREKVRLLSAHWTYIKHICGPDTCGSISINMDGTQYTDQAIGNGGSEIDASLLTDTFFTESEDSMVTVIPGVPGQWIGTPHSFVDGSTGEAFFVGQGTDGHVYYTKFTAGAWTNPAIL